MDDREYIEANRAHWDELAAHHPDTDHYDVEAFLDGESTLRDLERGELDAAGARVLHLQCHFGLDTLSSIVTGFSVWETLVEHLAALVASTV
ncbi:MAG: hypothetical protein ABEH77_03420 [Halobacteriaceae archaeon]